jgi:hypothetical protein
MQLMTSLENETHRASSCPTIWQMNYVTLFRLDYTTTTRHIIESIWFNEHVLFNINDPKSGKHNMWTVIILSVDYGRRLVIILAYFKPSRDLVAVDVKT